MKVDTLLIPFESTVLHYFLNLLNLLSLSKPYLGSKPKKLSIESTKQKTNSLQSIESQTEQFDTRQLYTIAN